MTDAEVISLCASFGAPMVTGKGSFRATDADLNDKRLLDALNNAIEARGKIETEQRRYDVQIAEYEASRASLLQNNASPHEISQIENEIADALYHRWLVEQQLNRAADSAEERLAYLQTLNTPEKQASELEHCADGLSGLLHWWRYWAWTADPRPDAPLMYVPFSLFECQIDLVKWLWDLIFVRNRDGHLDKSRDLGASWIATTFGVGCWLNTDQKKPFLALYGSQKEEKVDQLGNPKTIFEKMRITLRLVPGWMLPKGFSMAKHGGFLRIVNPVNASLLGGESANENFGRGDRQTVIFLDESAAWPSGGFAPWTSCSESTRSRIAFSTPQGKFNKFGELKEDRHIAHFSLRWDQHPWKTQQAYEIAKRRLSAVELAQEWDLDYEGSVAGRLLPMFSEVCSVITWSEFVSYFGASAVGDDGQPRIPKGWRHTVAHDCGTTDDHPSVIIAAAMSPANSRLPKHLFFYEQIFMGEGAHPLLLAPIIKEKLKKYIKDSDIESWLISHEANAERLIYNQEFGLPFEQWNTEAGYTQGYPQTQHYLTPYPGKNPFRSEIEGHPRAFIIVEDRQGKLVKGDDGKLKVSPPLNNEGGFKRLREELPRIHIPQSEAGKPVKAQRHFKKFDDAFDTLRAVMAQMPTMVQLTDSERVQQRLREEFRRQQLAGTMETEGYQMYYAYQEERAAIERDVEEIEGRGRKRPDGTNIQTLRTIKR